MRDKEKLNLVLMALENENYEEALAIIDKCIFEGDSSNQAYIYKSKALEKLGRINEASGFFWRKIYWANPSNEDVEMIHINEMAAEANGDRLISYRMDYIYNCILGNPISAKMEEVAKGISINCGKLEMSPHNASLYHELAWYHAAQSRVAEAAIYLSAYRYFSEVKPNIIDFECGKVISYFPNVSDIYMYFKEDEKTPIGLCVENEERVGDYSRFARLLNLMGRKAIVIMPDILFDVEDQEYDIEYFINQSYLNRELVDGVSYYVPVTITRNGQFVESTRFPLMKSLSESMDSHFPFFAEKDTLDHMQSPHVSRKDLHYVFNAFNFKNQPTSMSFAYIGGYDKYLNRLMEIDVLEHLKKNPKYRFSIVIPVRNNISTLDKTLVTCMQQTFKDYEIVISDNSDNNNTSVYDLVRSLECDKIKYYKTPKKLPISKSFEFAYLMSEGEFLIPIGADDGLFHNSLRDINIAIEKFPEQNIILWDRVHYVWPEFMFSAQSNQLVISEPYTPDHFDMELIESGKVLSGVLQRKISQYFMPLLYLNSGMKRSYLGEMLEKTGAMIDGIAQDVYTGMVNLFINREFLYLKHPITLAALSSNSSGAVSLRGYSSEDIALKRDEEYLTTNIGNCMERGLERLFPRSDGDIAVILASLLRLVDAEVVSQDVLNNVDWKVMTKGIIEQLQYNDLQIERVILNLLDSSQTLSEELFQWLSNEITESKIRFLYVDEDDASKYYTGFDENHSLHLDGSKFNINDVVDAVEFVQNLLSI